MNKICVYAIAKNESQFVERWIDSMQEADYIVVLDTGSKDDTFEKLKNDSRITRVEQKIINPWRFDVARNESLKLVPDDANILICTDLDEILHAGWAEALRKNWIDGFHERCYYQYIWSHAEDGAPARIFWYDKIHNRNWLWKHPVHEMLYNIDGKTGDYVNEHSLRLWNEIILEHFPDYNKSRSTYLPLLELRAEENPDDYYGLFYLSHEYFYQKLYDKSIEILKKIINEYKDHYSSIDLAAAYLFLGDNYRNKGDKFKAIYYYNLGIKTDPSYRECYLNAAEIYNELQMYKVALAYVETALEKTYRHFTWVERDFSYKGQPADIMSIALYYIAIVEKNIDKKREILLKANKYMEEALFYNKDDKRLKYNQKFIADAINNL